MTTLKEYSEKYEPKVTRNISELDKFPVDLELLDGTGTDKDDKEFEYKYIIVDGEEYRIPYTVIGQIKNLLEKKPDTKFVSVLKEGTGLKTKYQTIPME